MCQLDNHGLISLNRGATATGYFSPNFDRSRYPSCSFPQNSHGKCGCGIFEALMSAAFSSLIGVLAMRCKRPVVGHR